MKRRIPVGTIPLRAAPLTGNFHAGPVNLWETIHNLMNTQKIENNNIILFNSTYISHTFRKGKL